MFGGDGGDQSVESPHSGVAVTRSLFGVAVHFDDGVVEVDQYRTVDPGQYWGSTVQSGHQSVCHGIELADVTEAEFPQE